MTEDHATRRDRFEILAFHNRSVKTFEELDERLEDTVEEFWGGKALPLPILLDDTGETYERFSVRSLGTCVLIDPAGNVVRGQGDEILERVLRDLAAEAKDAE